MAISFEMIHKGEAANYHAIIETRFDYVENVTRVVLGLYRDEASYNLSKTNILERRTITIDGVDYTTEEIYAEIVKPKPIVLTPAVEEILEVVENGVVTRPYQAPVAATYKETNIFAVEKTEAELAQIKIDLAVEKLWQFVDKFGEEQFDRNFRERCLAWLVDPASSETRLSRIADMWTWGDTFWTEFYRVKTLILAGNYDTEFNTANITESPWKIIDIASV